MRRYVDMIAVLLVVLILMVAATMYTLSEVDTEGEQREQDLTALSHFNCEKKVSGRMGTRRLFIRMVQDLVPNPAQEAIAVAIVRQRLDVEKPRLHCEYDARTQRWIDLEPGDHVPPLDPATDAPNRSDSGSDGL